MEDILPRFFENASVVDYDLNTKSIFTYNNNLILFIDGFNQFNNYILTNHKANKKDYNNKEYYKKLVKIYNLFESLNSSQVYKSVFNEIDFDSDR